MPGVPIVFRCGTEDEWNAHDPVLFAGELGLVLSGDPDTQLMKIGNGVNTWSELPWAARGPRGYDFAYSWDGTSLGVKHTDEADYTYVDLGMYFDWTGTQLGIKRGTDAEYTYQELSPDFQWDDTRLGVKNPADEDYTYTGLGLQFAWDGYSLGVKRDEDADFVYTNLRGANFEYEWTGTSLGIKTSDEEDFTRQELSPDTNWDGTQLGIKNPAAETYTYQELSPDISWDGTQLGIKNPAAAEYTYQNLALQYTWTGTELGVKNPDEETYAYVDLKGEKGDKPDHQWDGTSLQFEQVDGAWGSLVDLKGETGDPGVLSKGKMWVGNKNDVAEETDPPQSGGGIDDAAVARKIMFYMRQYIGDEYELPEVRSYAPTVNHDETDTAQIGRNFRPFDAWVFLDGSKHRLFVCMSASSGDAAWKEIPSTDYNDLINAPDTSIYNAASYRSPNILNKQSSAKERESRRKNLFYSL